MENTKFILTITKEYDIEEILRENDFPITKENIERTKEFLSNGFVSNIKEHMEGELPHFLKEYPENFCEEFGA